MQERHAAAAGSAEQEGNALLPCQCSQLGAVGSYQRLVGGDHMLFGLEGLFHPAAGRLNAAQNLHHSVHSGVAGDGVDGCDFKGCIVLTSAYQHRACLQSAGVMQHLINALTHCAKA